MERRLERGEQRRGEDKKEGGNEGRKRDRKG